MIDARHRNTALLVAGCFFMENLDGTIVTTAAPSIGESLGVPPTAVGLVMTAYLLTLSVLIPLSAWLTSRLGVRPVFLAAIAIFTLASLGCAASGSLPVLVAMRVVQGVGGAMMVPVGRMVVLSRTDKSDLLRVMAYIVWPGLLAPVVAPLAGALITTYASWQWLFLINVPLGVFAFAVAWKLIGEADSGTARRPLDWLGLLLTCGGLGGITYAAHLISDTDAGWPVTATLTALCLAVLAVACWHLLRAPSPLVTLHTLRVPTFRLSQSSGFLFWIVVGAAPFLYSLMCQEVFGYSATSSGALVLFIFVGNLVIKPATTPLLNRFGFRPVLLAATITLALCMTGLGFTTSSTPWPMLAGLALLSGVARSVGLTAYATIGLSDVPPEQMRDANTLAATTQQLSTGLAIAVATVALRLGEPLGELVSSARGGAAYTVAFTLLGLTALIATAGALRLHPHAGNAVRTIRPPRPAGVG
ncbi:drug resistance transporter, EmrB/QacA subfamily [Saccharopolyspora shandongensis]|uniref:Drug resistance transporter, EmrB/QacA subfamily n=1 Tax=Saccharopolyspora shandongensis TaxID=418495 RepID=A0A1H3U7W1_9PSEU|nr:MFS transporter [Saccharopolyspora shandongensis]SDZ58377.1 drug resistance transporter, EmrB/QacA subfamily [Saccharopolyspora shandongensis]